MSPSKTASIIARSVRAWCDRHIASRQESSPVTMESLEERRLFTWYGEFVGAALANAAKPGGDPVILASGTLELNTTDIQSDGFGSDWGVTRSWTNNPAYNVSQNVGNGWMMNQNPQILQVAQPSGSDALLEIVTSGSSAIWFENTGTTGSPVFVPYYDTYDQLTYNSGTDIYTLTDQQGNQTNFYGFSNSSYGSYQGSFASYTPASGSTITVVSHNSAGNITQEVRSQTVSDVTTIESMFYTYYGSGYDSGELENVALERSTDGGTLYSIVRQVQYTYYNADDPNGNGNLDDLETASIENVFGTVLSEDYYRYYLNSTDTPDQLEFEFTGPEFARMQAAVTSLGYTPFTAPDSDVSPYALLQLNYDSDGMSLVPGAPGSSGDTAYAAPLYPVVYEVVGGMGSTEDGGVGQGVYYFSYCRSTAFSGGSLTFAPDDSGSASQYNTVAYITNETLPSGLDDVVYMNYAGEPILESQSDESTSRDTYNQYNAQARVSETVSPLAIISVAYDDSAGTVTPSLSSTIGQVDTFDYYSGNSSAGATTAGSANGFPEDEKVSLSGGTADEVEFYDYKSQTAGGITIYYVADDTVFSGISSTGSGGETTSYQFNFTSGTFSPTSLLTTLPTITTAQNGSNNSSTNTQVFDSDGNVVWDLDPDGHITYDTYDIVTGAITMQIQDVTLNDYSYYNTSFGAAAPFTIPSSDGLALVTTYEDDPEGRTIEETSPNGNVTYITYDDANHETRVYPGWHYDPTLGEYTTTGPVQVEHDDWVLGYDESFTYAYTPSDATVPEGTDTPGTIESLSRNLLSYGGQVIELDDYFNLSGVSYSASSFQLGSSGTNYYQTLYSFDLGGNQDSIQLPTGTINATAFNEYNEPISTSVGTVSGAMTEVSQSSYDADGNLTETVDYPGGAVIDGGVNGRATAYYYNFRDQLIAEMTGAVEADGEIGSPAADTLFNDTFVSYYTLDNLGEVLDTQTYNANGAASVNFSTGTILGPASGSPMILTAASSAGYDNQGNIFSSTVINVEDGSEGTADTTNYYRDADGNLIATILPTGEATKYVYNGAGWMTSAYTTDGGQINNASNITVGSSTAYAAVASITHDIVLAQVQYEYDNDGNVVETITSDRFSTDSASNTSTGALGTPTTGVYARVSYDASYFDAADRDVADINAGTYDGSAYPVPIVYQATSGSTTSLTDTAFTGSGPYTGDVIVILTGSGAGERATVTGYNTSTHVFSFAAISTGGDVAPASDSTFILVDPVSLVTQMTFNAAGRMQNTIDPSGIVAQTNYDLMGRKTQTIEDFTNGTPTNSSNQMTTYTYDGDSNVLTMTANMSSGQISQVTHYIYAANTSSGSVIDDNDLLSEVQYPDPNTGSNYNASGYTYNQSEGYAYDALGEQTGYIDRNGTTHTYTYNTQGQLTTDSVSIASSGVDGTVTELGYAYNNAGQMSEAVSYNSGDSVLNTVQDTYDGFGNLLSETQSNSTNVSSGTVSYTYDAANGDRPTSITYPDGRVIEYVYNPGLDCIVSRISNVSSGSTYIQAYTYLGLDTPVTFADQNGVELSYVEDGATGAGGDQYVGLDRFGRIVEQNWSGAIDEEGPGTGPGIDQFDYNYNQDGDVTSIVNVTNTSSGTTNTTLAGESHTYTYDQLNRVTNFSTGTFNTTTGTITTPTATEGWSLDALGNWFNSSSGGMVTARTNNAQNQATVVGSATLDYDANGNTTTDQTGQKYVYDAWNRLVKVENAQGQVIVAYGYDALGRRITETQAPASQDVTTDLYYSNADQVIQESVGSLVTAEHVWSPFYVDAMIETDTNPQVTTNQSNGSVDSSFGVTNTSNHTTTTTLSYAVTSAVAAADGSDIIVATMVGTTPELLFYNASGGLDSSYGTSGVVTLSYLTSITGLVVQPDGDIDVSGNTSSGGLSVLQLNPTGTADSSFGSSGIETLTTLPAALGVIIADNGELLVDGVSGTNVTVTELNSSTGAVDTSYGSSGTASVSFNSSATSVSVIGMAESPAGELVLAGSFTYSVGLGTGSNRVLTELNASGGVDTTFGTSGIVTVSTGSALAPGYSPLAVTADGKILIGDAVQSGFNSPHSVTLKVTEYNSNGSLDTSFGTSGQASTGTISSDGSGLILNIQTNGQIVIGIGGTSGYFILARFDANGSLDSNFGSSGIKIGAADGMGLAMVTAANGEIVMIGTPSSGNGILLQEFGTLASHQTLYVEYDADYNVTSLTDSSGNVLERYEYDPYGTVTVLNANGTQRGDGTAASSFFAWVYLDQGMRYTVSTGTYASETRIYGPSLGRWMEQDPTAWIYVDGPNLYQAELDSPIGNLDFSGEVSGKEAAGAAIGTGVGKVAGAWIGGIIGGVIGGAEGLSLGPEGVPILGALEGNAGKKIGQTAGGFVGGIVGGAIGRYLGGNAGSNSTKTTTTTPPGGTTPPAPPLKPPPYEGEDTGTGFKTGTSWTTPGSNLDYGPAQ